MTLHLSPSDINVIADDPRVASRRLADGLGFAQPHKINHLIDRNTGELKNYGEVPSTVDETPSEKGGRPGRVFWLNEPQALLICMFARTANAAEVRRMLIEAFMAWRTAQAAQGAAPALAAPMLAAPEGETADLSAATLPPATVASLNAKLGLIREARLAKADPAMRGLFERLGLGGVYRAAQGEDGPAAEPDADARACLRHLLTRTLAGDDDREATFAEIITRALEGDERARYDLIGYGVRLEEDGFGGARVWVASYGAGLAHLYAGTRWSKDWRVALKRLPGAKGTGNYKVDKVACRGVSIPASYLGEALAA